MHVAVFSLQEFLVGFEVFNNLFPKFLLVTSDKVCIFLSLGAHRHLSFVTQLRLPVPYDFRFHHAVVECGIEATDHVIDAFQNQPDLAPVDLSRGQCVQVRSHFQIEADLVAFASH